MSTHTGCTSMQEYIFNSNLHYSSISYILIFVGLSTAWADPTTLVIG